LAVLIQTEHEQSESFVRYGPIQKMKKEDDRRIGVYPWRFYKGGALIKSSVDPHVTSVVKFINDMLKRIPNEEVFERMNGVKIFMIILWVLHLLQAIAISELCEYVDQLTSITLNDLKNKLFCMKLAGWVDNYTYGNKTFWYSISDNDPVSRYSFNSGVVNRPSERKIEVSAAIYSKIMVPKHVRTYVAAAKVSGKKGVTS
jgi:hypothetical protein